MIHDLQNHSFRMSKTAVIEASCYLPRRLEKIDVAQFGDICNSSSLKV
jgi:hypothetical protein